MYNKDIRSSEFHVAPRMVVITLKIAYKHNVISIGFVTIKLTYKIYGNRTFGRCRFGATVSEINVKII